MKRIFFISDREEFGFMSNFSYCPQKVSCFGMTARTTEHIYQAMKIDAGNTKARDAMCRVGKPSDVKALGSAIACREDWNRVKVDVMRQLVCAKFEQNPTLAERLLATGDAELIEDAPWDKFWGSGQFRNWDPEVGRNELGKILMQVRDELRSRQ